MAAEVSVVVGYAVLATQGVEATTVVGYAVLATQGVEVLAVVGYAILDTTVPTATARPQMTVMT